MLKMYCKTALRFFRRSKGYTLINSIGLCIGLTCFILILLYVQYEFSYDRQHVRGERIYRVFVDQRTSGRQSATSHSPVPLAPRVLRELPEVENAVRFYTLGSTLIRRGDHAFYEAGIRYVDPSVFEVFSIPLLQGDARSALEGENSIVISAGMADKYFGNDDPIGQELQLEGIGLFRVSAVMQDFPQNTHVSANMFLPFRQIESSEHPAEFAENWNSQLVMSYLLLKEGAAPGIVTEQCNRIFRTQQREDDPRRLGLENLWRLHLYSTISDYSDIRYIRIFLSIGLFILLIACINFTNLSTARAALRAREVGVRKTLGVRRRTLVGQFLFETILLSFLALLLALLLADLFLPIFRQLTGQELAGNQIWSGSLLIRMFPIALMVGLVAGAYPAFYLSSFRPVSVLQGVMLRGKRGRGFRRILVVLQFGISVLLIIATLTIGKQLDFLQNKELGFRKDRMVILPLNSPQMRQTGVEDFRQEIQRDGRIAQATASWTLPSRARAVNRISWEGANDGDDLKIMMNRVDHDFLNTYEIPLLKGRGFSREFPGDRLDYANENAGAVILNEEAVRQIGWSEPLGKQVIQMWGEYRWYFTVVGVMRDFHFSSLKNEIRPMYLMLDHQNLENLSVKLNTLDIAGALAFLENRWREFYPDIPFEYSFLDEQFEHQYRNVQKTRALFQAFTVVAIGIALLGSLGLAAHAVQSRRKEVGIRKVLGASVLSIGSRIGREFVIWIIIANALAWPLAYLAMLNWLQEYAYRIHLGFSIFAMAGLMSLVAALVPLIWQSIAVANTNPVETLWDE